MKWSDVKYFKSRNLFLARVKIQKKEKRKPTFSEWMAWKAWSLNQSTSPASQSTVGSRSVDAVAILVRCTRPASESDLSVVEACPWVVHHHADYSTTQRERSVQENTGKLSLGLRVASVLHGYTARDWSTPCRFQGAFSLPLDGFLFS